MSKIVALLLLLAPVAAAQELSPLWRETRRIDAAPPQVAAIGQKFGVSLTSIANVTYDACGVPVQVNTIVCATERDAETLLAALARGGKPPETLGRRGTTVIELVGGARQVLLAARAGVGLPFEDVRWQVRVMVSPLVEVDPDPTAWNELFNLLWGVRQGRPVAEEASRRAAKFRFGESIAAPGFEVTAEEPALGLVRLVLNGTVTVRPFAGHQEPRPHRDLTSATPRWPVDQVAHVTRELDEGNPSERRRVEWALGWMRAHVRYDGDMGSRWGTLRVIEQGFGRCWDHSDVLITLCRAMALPARQVYGWLAGVSGHVWAEVFVDGAWWPVDATASWLGVSEDYVPIFISEDGEMRAVYWGPPDQLERQR
jgi:transglutaminase-like putative cysteine protease